MSAQRKDFEDFLGWLSPPGQGNQRHATKVARRHLSRSHLDAMGWITRDLLDVAKRADRLGLKANVLGAVHTFLRTIYESMPEE